MKKSYLNDIKKIIKEFYSKNEQTHFVPGKSRVPLALPPYGWEEVCEALDSFLRMQTTMGTKVKKFEELFARYIGVKYAIMVNSGSSANLLAFSILSNPSLGEKRIKKADEVITPAVTWPTTVYPIINVGAKPVFVDVDLRTYNIDPRKIEGAITKKTKAIMPVHLLGYPCDVNEIKKIADRHNLYLIEDSCEAHGAEYHGKKVGSFGIMSTFSFFVSHHITTMEGGMLLTNNKRFYELGKSIRAFGWIRELSKKREIAKKYKKIDPRYLFINTGYNIRPTEIQGAFGLQQIKKLDHFIKIRTENFNYFRRRFSNYSDFITLPPSEKGYKNACMLYPITVIEKTKLRKDELVSFLEKNGIETRPVFSGNMVEQPVMKSVPYRQGSDLRNSEYVMKNSFLIGVHQGINEKMRNYVADLIIKFIENRTKK